MELISLSEKCYYIKGAINIGLIKADKGAILIDCGIDKQTAKSIEKILGQEGLKLTHIINTHAHADHFGGSQYLKENHGALVLAPKEEAAIMEHPSLEPFYLFGGAHPIKELNNKFLLAPPVAVDQHLNAGTIAINGVNLQIVPLPGHTMGQVGIALDNTLYMADAVFGPEVLQKHGIPYFVDIDLQLKTLDYLESLSFEFYVPAHGEVTADIKELTKVNRKYIYKITNKVRELLPGGTEEMVAKVLNWLQISVNNPGQYLLMRAATLAHISYLSDLGEVTWELDKNYLKWRRNTKPDKYPAKTN